MANDFSPKAVGARILKACEELGWTQAELSKVSKITPASISQFVNGERVPSTPLLNKIAVALNVTVDFLLNGESVRPVEDRKFAVFFRDFQGLDKKEQELIKANVQLLKEKNTPKG